MRRILAIAVATTLTVGAAALPAVGTTTPWATQDDVRVVGTTLGGTGGSATIDGDRLYVGAYGQGMRIFDIANPRDPVQIGTYAPPTIGPYDPGFRAEMTPYAATWDERKIAVLAGAYHTGSNRQTEFLDVTDPADPVLLHRFTSLPDRGARGALAAGDRLWLPTEGAPSGGLRIYDLDPLLGASPEPPTEVFRGNPQELWTASPYRTRLGKPAGSAFATTRDLSLYEDMTVLLPQWEWEPDAAGVPQPTHARKDILLLAAGSSAGDLPLVGSPPNQGAVYVIDITDPTAPVVINKWQNPDDGGHPMHDMLGAQFLDGDAGTLVVTDRDPFGDCDAGRLYTVSISEDLLDMEKRGEWAIGSGQADQPLCAGPRGFSSHDGHVFVAASVAGVQVLDVRDPAEPVRVGRYVTEGADYLDAVHHEGVVYAGDQGPRGLDVLEYLGEVDTKAVVRASNPGSDVVGGGLSEGMAACDPGSDRNGLDGLWVAIPAAERDGDATVQVLGSSPLGHGLEVRFFDEACGQVGGGFAGDGDDIDAPIPEDAVYVHAHLTSGPTQWLYLIFSRQGGAPPGGTPDVARAASAPVLVLDRSPTGWAPHHQPR